MSMAGVSQGVLDAMQTMRQNAYNDQIKAMHEQQMQVQGFQLNQAQQHAAAQDRAGAGLGTTLSNMTSAPPPQPQMPPPQAPAPAMPNGAQAPAPGQPSVAAAPPRPAQPPQPPQQIPPYHTVASLQQRAPGAPPAPNMGPPPPQPQRVNDGGFTALTPQAMMKSLKEQGVPANEWLGQLELAKPLFDEAGRQQLTEMRIQQQANAAAQRTMALEIARLRAQAEGRHWNAQDKAAAEKAVNGKKPTAGNMNQFSSRETAEIKPIDTAQRQSQEIRGMLATDNPASSVQLQKLLTMYLQSGRQTNITYLGNKGFGSYPERLKNTISRIFSGNYSEVNKADIKDLVDQMDKTVFNPARAKVVDKYKKQAKIMNIDPSLADSANAFDTSSPPADSGGWKVEKVQ